MGSGEKVIFVGDKRSCGEMLGEKTLGGGEGSTMPAACGPGGIRSQRGAGRGGAGGRKVNFRGKFRPQLIADPCATGVSGAAFSDHAACAGVSMPQRVDVGGPARRGLAQGGQVGERVVPGQLIRVTLGRLRGAFRIMQSRPIRAMQDRLVGASPRPAYPSHAGCALCSPSHHGGRTGPAGSLRPCP